MADTPNIRFEGFTGDWEQRKFEDIFKLFQGLQIPINERFTEPGVNRYFYITNEFLKDTCEEAYYIELPSENVVCNEEDILMTRTGNTGTVVTDVKGCFHNNFFKIKYDKDTFSKKYICYLLSSSHMQKVILNSAGSSTIPDLSHKAFYKIVGCFPTSKEEQDKIGDYLANLDNLITLHQRKCAETRELKKYMLKKMFPQNGEKIPEIRFSGFFDDWEQREFSDFTYPAGKRNRNNLDLEPYAITSEQGFIPQSKAHDDFGYMKDIDRLAYNIVSTNSFAYNPARINIGSIGYYEGEENVIVSSLYEVFQTVDYVDDKFLWHWFKSDEFPKWIERLQEGSVRLYFYYDKLCECQMLMPSVAEQKKIAGFLDNFNRLITLHQRKFDELKEVKKFMLQNMFPQKG